VQDVVLWVQFRVSMARSYIAQNVALAIPVAPTPYTSDATNRCEPATEQQIELLCLENSGMP